MSTTHKRLRVAVIGAGHLGRIHSRLLNANPAVKLAVVCDPQPLAQQAAITEFNVRAASDYRKLISEFDAAVIATPSFQHAEIALDLMAHGKHLLIEKPLTIASADAWELAHQAAARGVCIQVGHVERFNPAVQAACAAVGNVRVIEAQRLSGFTFRSTDIGVVHDLMIHDIDLACHYLTGKLTQIQASGQVILGDHEDQAECRLEFADGGVAKLTASRCSPTAERSLRIIGSEGIAAVDLTRHTVRLSRFPQWLRRGDVDFLALDETQRTFVKENLFTQILPTEEVSVPPINAIEREQLDWLQAIRENRQPTIPADQGARNVEVAEQILNQIQHRQKLIAKFAGKGSTDKKSAASGAGRVGEVPMELQPADSRQVA
jgi:predicted dehydrogenase